MLDFVSKAKILILFWGVFKHPKEHFLITHQDVII
jgi:hypothetical protein